MSGFGEDDDRCEPGGDIGDDGEDPVDDTAWGGEFEGGEEAGEFFDDV